MSIITYLKEFYEIRKLRRETKIADHTLKKLEAESSPIEKPTWQDIQKFDPKINEIEQKANESKWYKKAAIQTQIIAGIFIILAALVGIIPHLTSIKESSHQTNTERQNQSDSSSANNLADYQYFSSLSDEQLQRMILRLLHIDKIDSSIYLIKHIEDEQTKRIEVWHVFNYCINSNNFEKARELISLFSSTTDKERAQRELDLAILRNSNNSISQ